MTRRSAGSPLPAPKIIGAVLVKFDPKKADVGANYMLGYYAYGEDEDGSLAA